MRKYSAYTLNTYGDPSGFNSRAPAQCSSVDPPTPDQVKGHNVWVFLPLTLVQQCVRDMELWECSRGQCPSRDGEALVDEFGFVKESEIEVLFNTIA